MDGPAPGSGSSGSDNLTLVNVGIGFTFIALDAVFSVGFGLGIGGSLLVAAARCILQLSVMALLLDKVFASHNVWGVFGIAILLNVLGAIEATYNKTKRRFNYMFPLVLASLLAGSMPISIIGTRYAMGQIPFWTPTQYVPILGMLLGNAISSIGIAVNSVQKEFVENRDKIETYLAMGASRFEACKPIGREALKLSLLPTINQMSVIGLISIPGMMTGAIIGGKSVEQAARLQMIIMFLISATSALCALLALLFCLLTLCDSRHRLRPDRLNSGKPLFYRWRDALGSSVYRGLKNGVKMLTCQGTGVEKGTEEERRSLLDGQQQQQQQRDGAGSGGR